ncbi:lipopolysaccharide biosynthesis protein [Ferrimonas balearica]|uniref:lipopolysaccharide biosynthesis protein n=1 Tax=Ferrimonas balearica TaxID=44012 RepID=UPI001C57607D|nr:lipopolysaccharide biosynthesis protein [Ferrimonas balearica]MBW3138188.1 lipopolysaccharide biosynthesis protein [Ferrimonas balearica]
MVTQRYTAFRKSLSNSDFNNIDFLKSKAKEVEETDPELAIKILTRVHALQKKKLSFTQKTVLEKERKFIDSGKITTPIFAPTIEDKKKVETKESEPEIDNNQAEIAEQEPKEPLSKFEELKDKLNGNKFALFVLLPTLLLFLYLVLLASPRYEARVQLVVKQPETQPTMDASMMLLSGLGVNSSSNDNELIRDYIYSADMLAYLEDTIQVIEHYSSDEIDLFSRLPIDASKEEILEYYLKRIKVEISEKSGVISVAAQGFEPGYTKLIIENIAQRSEWYVNQINSKLAEQQLTFLYKEHEKVEQKLAYAQDNMQNFQIKYNQLSPEIESVTVSNVISTIEANISSSELRLIELGKSMSESAPQYISERNRLESLKQQLEQERNKLTERSHFESKPAPINEILTEYQRLKIDLELATRMFTASIATIEKTKVDSYKQVKFLMYVESPFTPESAKYPAVTYNILLAFSVLSMIFFITRIVILTIKEI